MMLMHKYGGVRGEVQDGGERRQGDGKIWILLGNK